MEKILHIFKGMASIAITIVSRLVPWWITCQPLIQMTILTLLLQRQGQEFFFILILN